MQEKDFLQLRATVDSFKKNVAELSTIAELTKVLAFNASIEAVHAGKSGGGMRIVAGEFKKLSERSRRTASALSLDLQKLCEELLRDF